MITQDSIVKLHATVRPEGITWEMSDDTRRLGRGCVATLEELRGIEVRGGLASSAVFIRGALTVREAAIVHAYGWKESAV